MESKQWFDSTISRVAFTKKLEAELGFPHYRLILVCITTAIFPGIPPLKTKNEKNQINFCKATFCLRFLDARCEKTELSQPTGRAQSFARREKPLTFIGSDTR